MTEATTILTRAEVHRLIAAASDAFREQLLT